MSLISRFVLSDTRIVDHGEGFYPGMSIPCADSFSGFCVHGKCEINKYNMATCRFVTASAVNVSNKYIKMKRLFLLESKLMDLIRSVVVKV